MKKVSDKDIINAYKQHGNVWKVADVVGLCGQSVYERLNKLGLVNHINYWTEKDDMVLKEKYISYKMANKLNILAAELGRTKQFICRKAKLLGLTDRKNVILCESARKKISAKMKKYIQENGHPRGYLGHRHGTSTREKISNSSKRAWSNPQSALNSEEHRQRQSDYLHKKKIEGRMKQFSIRGEHNVNLGGVDYVFKSSWEAEIGRRLQNLLCKGDILKWGYETKHFVFNDIKRGIRSYCPDFEIQMCNGENLYIEVKGWKMPQAMKRIAMFRERYPNIKFYLIDEKEYGKIISESDYLRGRCIEIQSI